MRTHQRPAPLLFALTAVVALFMLAPMALSVTAGLVNNYSDGLRSGLTLRWIRQVLDGYGSTVVWSLIIASACALGNLILGVPCAYGLARSTSRWARVFEELIILPVAVPGLATGLALILAYGHLRGFRQSFAIILVGQFNLTWMLHTPLTRTLPVGLADSYASMRLEVGSAYTLVFFVVVLPLLWLFQYLANLVQRRYET